MRCLVLADVRASLGALEAVLTDAGAVDGTWCLGDVVDLGPAAEECVRMLRGLGALCVRGNHDLGTGPEFKRVPLVAESIVWTRGRLSAGSRAWLEGMPERVEIGGVALMHDVAEGGHTRAPQADDFAKIGRSGMLVGHFHLPFVLREGETEGRAIGIGDTVRTARAIVNPGPVGVSDWRPGWASYGLLDTETLEMEIRGIEVEVAPGEDEIARLGAPPRLAAYWRRQAGDAAQARGELDQSRALFRLSARAFDSSGDQRQLTTMLVGLADLARRAGDPERAGQLLGAVQGAMAEHPVVRHRVAGAESALRIALGAEALAAERARGAGLSLPEATALGLS